MPSEPKIKLINSAIEVFANNGYRGARVSDIVAGADANIAAVNYHFGSKENLYMQAIRKAHEISEMTYPTRGNLPQDAPAREKLSSYVRSCLKRSLDKGPAGQFGRIFAKTMYSPDSPVKRVLDEAHDLELDYIQEMLIEFYGTDAPAVIQLAKINVVCLSSVLSNYPITSSKIFSSDPSPKEIDSMIENQVNVTLAALDSLTPENAFTR
ncbi:transcriptional regulator, TetR family [Rubritalea squalenifaciens DSM 18772]|uniref:Transcriptional regulator, TetR family n=1 Tax=Rubritalea squalenifaciens DSM 18772 TaxID=1123071 RepID=A0A1M6KPL9_9BACT|nr:TetR/AcrR family transcriptional regulator [Rubritalea squalenifaciens]SHJ60842.1 transcriptional regulator, TetR family [Rubritalea squalenifaciens DSM 18772]